MTAIHAEPRDPIAAVIHADPYRYHGRLARDCSMYRDEALGVWIASGAQALTSVLTSDLMRVRPLNAQVPGTIVGSQAAEIFRHLVRMVDGASHVQLKAAVSSALHHDDLASRAASAARAWTQALLNENEDPAPVFLQRAAFGVRVAVIAALLGAAPDDARQAPELVGMFVRAIGPSGTAEEVRQGSMAATALLARAEAILASQEASNSRGLLALLNREAARQGATDRKAVVANAVGFMSQAYEATAGLILGTVLALAADGDLYGRVRWDSKDVAMLVEEVLRYDPPVQNTRRYVAQDCVVAGQDMHMGDAILLVLAAANRDPTANPAPDTFDIDRRARRTFVFGHGVHACPGAALAVSIAAAAVGVILRSPMDLRDLAAARYVASANVRIPVLGVATGS